MIQSIMLAALGFFAASLLVLLIAPAFWARAVRLTNRRLREALPLSEQEVRADKDLLRAEFALKVHQLEREVEQVRLSSHRQQIEINRRDIDVRRLKDSLATNDAALTENRNARSVLEQTVTERIPALEHQLAEARAILRARDTAIDELQATSASQTATIEEGRAILTQRALEVQRLQALFQEVSAHGRDLRADGGSDSLMLRAEIEQLKARLAERAAVIDRLQSEVTIRPRVAALLPVGVGNGGLLPEYATPDQMRALIAEQSKEIVQLRQDAATRSGSELSALPADSQSLTARHLLGLEEQVRAQATEIARLKADSEAAARAEDPTANARIRESKVWLRSRIQRAEDDLERERNTALRLRAELAAANERIARQSAQFRDELRKQTGRTHVPARDLAREASKAANPPSAAPEVAASPAIAAVPAVARPPASSRARELQRALQGQFGKSAAAPVEATTEPAGASDPDTLVQPAESAKIAVVSGSPLAASNDAAAATPAEPADPAARGRLLDRLKSYEQA